MVTPKSHKKLILLFALLLFALMARLALLQELGIGLTGIYFDSQNLAGIHSVRLDQAIDFDWGRDSPMSSMENDTFSVTWVGFIKPPKGGMNLPRFSGGKPTSTFTATITPTHTMTPTTTPLSYEVINGNGVNARSCPELICEVIVVLAPDTVIEVIETITGATVSGSDVWLVFLVAGERAYTHSSLVSQISTSTPTASPTRPSRPTSTPKGSTSSQTPAQPQQPVQATQTPQQSAVRPGNCSTAVAMGLNAQQAAQWSHLDRDGDGVACYGS